MLTLRQLRYLDALARHRHFGRAAEECAISQPALSMQIRELEKHLGVDLVERRPGEVILTDTGAEVARRAGQVLTSVRDLDDYARHRGRVLCGPLRLGMIPSLAPYLLPRILPPIQRKHPELKLELRETQTRALLEELSRGQLDAVMAALPVASPAEVETLSLFEDRFMLAAPASDPVAARGTVDIGAIDARRLILLEEGHCLRDQALAVCGAENSTLKELGATSLTTVMQMVASGYGVTLVPEIAVAVEARDERVRLLRFTRPEPHRVIGLAWRRTSPRAADFIALGKIVKDELAK